MAEHYSIWLIPGKNDQVYLQKLINRLSYEYNAPIFFPHCTLYSTSILSETKLEGIIKTIAIDTQPLFVELKRLNFTSDIWKTVIIELENSKSLTQLQKNLMKKIYRKVEYNFQPHISLMYKKLSFEKKKKIIKNLILKNFYKMEHICIVNTGDDIKNWNIISKIELNA